ncbi:MAG: hypothetical protein R3F42_00420 [Pseudomonadota bacterium]
MERREVTGSWYTRREGVVRGPFASAAITRYILLGRIRLDDELSRDRRSWSPASTLTGLLPHALLDLGSWEDYQRYIEARMQVDERRSERRRDTCPHCRQAHRERRMPYDRRRGELLLTPAHFPPAGRDAPAPGPAPTPRRRTLLLTVLLAMLVFAWLVPVAR